MAERADDNYIFDGTHPESFYADLSRAFGALLLHGNGGVFRLKRAMQADLAAVKITRTNDPETGDIVFRAEEVTR